MDCSGKCEKYRKNRRYDTPDTKYCPNCDSFVRWEGLFCPCCGTKMRANPRHSKWRHRYQEKRNVRRL